MGLRGDRPWSEACERNREPILRILREEFTGPGTVLEIGSGTGQHAVHFAAALPHVVWQPTDLAPNLDGIQRWAEDAALPNILAPVALDVCHHPWPVTRAQWVYSANTAHIMGWDGVEAMFAGAARVLGDGGRFCLYGPFHQDGGATSESNARFDVALRARDPASGIRHREDLEQLGGHVGLLLRRACPMPANNQLLVWERAPR